MSNIHSSDSTETIERPIVNRTWNQEAENIAKPLEEYVAPHLTSEDVKSVIEIGTGAWNYVDALSRFFRSYYPEARIEGIDRDPTMVDYAQRVIETLQTENTTISCKELSEVVGQHDITLSLGLNLSSNAKGISNGETYNSFEQYLKDIKSITRKNGLVILGITDPEPNTKSLREIVESKFTDVSYYKNDFLSLPTSSHPILSLIVARNQS